MTDVGMLVSWEFVDFCNVAVGKLMWRKKLKKKRRKLVVWKSSFLLGFAKWNSWWFVCIPIDVRNSDTEVCYNFY